MFLLRGGALAPVVASPTKLGALSSFVFARVVVLFRRAVASVVVVRTTGIQAGVFVLGRACLFGSAVTSVVVVRATRIHTCVLVLGGTTLVYAITIVRVEPVSGTFGIASLFDRVVAVVIARALVVVVFPCFTLGYTGVLVLGRASLFDTVAIVGVETVPSSLLVT